MAAYALLLTIPIVSPSNSPARRPRSPRRAAGRPYNQSRTNQETTLCRPQRGGSSWQILEGRVLFFPAGWLYAGSGAVTG